MNKLGVLVTRGQPLHSGHIKVINQALCENDKVLIVIGSADKWDADRNPFNINTRIQLYNQMLNLISDPSKVSYIALNDWSNDHDIPKQDNNTGIVDDASKVNKDWGMYLYYNIVAGTGQKEFTLYYNDDPSLVSAWFPEFLQSRITVSSSFRGDGISGSRVRQALASDLKKELHEYLPYLSEKQINNLKYMYDSERIYKKYQEVDLYE